MTVKSLCADSTTAIKSLPSEQFDLTILDPDYQDWETLIKQGFIEEALRVTKSTGNIICFTKQPFDHQLRNYIDPWFRREIVWSFSNGGAWVSKKMPLVSHQKIYWLVKSKDFYVDVRTGLDYQPTTKSVKRSTKQFGGWVAEGKQFDKSDEGTWIRDHYHFNKPHTGAIPSKPNELIRIIIKCFSPDNGSIFDPFSGSGIVGKIGDELGRDVLSIEINPERAGQPQMDEVS
jgi:DNA modification methylase